MYYIRTFNSGAKWDPRSKVWAEYYCSLCKKHSEIDITRVTETYDLSRERRCPKCGQISSDDKLKNIKAQIEKLTVQKNRTEVEIEKLINELNELERIGK